MISVVNTFHCAVRRASVRIIWPMGVRCKVLPAILNAYSPVAPKRRRYEFPQPVLAHCDTI